MIENEEQLREWYEDYKKAFYRQFGYLNEHPMPFNVWLKDKEVIRKIQDSDKQQDYNDLNKPIVSYEQRVLDLLTKIESASASMVKTCIEMNAALDRLDKPLLIKDVGPLNNEEKERRKRRT